MTVQTPEQGTNQTETTEVVAAEETRKGHDGGADEMVGDQSPGAEEMVGDETGKASREAAKYRTQLRKAEAERDALATRLDGMQRAEVQRLAAGPGGLADGADVWAGLELADALDESGQVDPERVKAAVSALLAGKPHYAHRRFTGSADGGAKVVEHAPELTWGAALAGR